MDVTKRDSTWMMFKPGLYIDPEGNGHVFPDEIVATLKLLFPEVPWDYEEDYDLIVQVCRDQLGSDCPIKFIKHTRESD